MKKDFIDSAIARQNVLNNSFAVTAIQKEIGLTGILFENEYKFLFKQITDFFEVTDRTIRECIARNEKELTKNGYEVLKGKRLVDFKLVATKVPGCEVDFTTKTTVLGIFNFRAFLNIAMLLVDSEKARSLRSAILDIAIDRSVRTSYSVPIRAEVLTPPQADKQKVSVRASEGDAEREAYQ